PSTLSKADQLKELQWFEKAAAPFKGMEINVVSETITTHEYESRTLAKAFTEITGIKVKHDLIQEGDVVEKLQTQMQSGKNVYDGWINDSDLIGTHFRYGQTVILSDYMSGARKDVQIYGHMDYGKKDPSLGWRFTDAWLSMAGNGDKGIPNGKPVDEWGIRMEGCRPVGSSVERGGDTNGPAAVYSIVKYLDWMKKYAPPQAQGMTFSESVPVPAQGAIAQQIFWYTAFTHDMVKPGIPVVNADGTPKWRMAPSPHGSYWN